MRNHPGDEKEANLELGAGLLILVIVGLILLLTSAFAEGQIPGYTTKDFRSVTATATGVTSIQLCGSSGLGVFFNSGDQGGGSCIDGSAFAPAWVLQGSQIWVPLGNSSSLRETGCLTAAYAGGCSNIGIARCPAAKVWQVFHVPDLAYLGQSDTAGGVPVPVQKVSFACPSPTSGTVVTITARATPSVPAPSFTPTAPPSTQCPGPITLPSAQNPTCYCADTGKFVTCPGPATTSSPTRTVTSVSTAPVPTTTSSAVPSATATVTMTAAPGITPTLPPIIASPSPTAIGTPFCPPKSKSAGGFPLEALVVAGVLLWRRPK